MLVASVVTSKAPVSAVLMSYYVDDPWAVSDNDADVDMAGGDLDIMDVSEDEPVRTAPYLHSSPGWITEQKKQAFLYGCPQTDHQAKAQAYQALRTPTEVQSFLGLDADMGPCQIADVRSQPADKDAGYQATERQGQGPDMTAVVATLLKHKELIESCGMVYLIVDNRTPEEVDHWPAFAQWWEARRTLVGPQQERTDVVWVQATHANGLRAVPYCWAGVFVLEAARFLYPKVHFGLVDNDCVPVTLFEVKDLIALAESQFRWPDLVGHRADPDLASSKVGMLLFTEAHLEYNAGLVISIGSTNRPSPVDAAAAAENLAEELEDYRQQLLAMAAPPECPTDASQGGSLFTPLIGVPWKTRSTLQLFGHCMAHICAINSGQCQVVGKGVAVINRNQRPSSGLNELILEPSPKQDKNAHDGSLAGPEPPLNKAVCQCCLTWKDHAKQFPFLESIFFRRVE